MILKACVAVLIIVIALAGAPLLAEASEPTQKPMTILLIDGSSVRESEEDIDSVRSLITMISSIGTDREVAFIDTERPSIVIGPTSLGSANFAETISSIDAELVSGNSEASDIFMGLVQANTLIGLERPALGSNVVFITSGSSTENTAAAYKIVIPLFD